MSNDENNIQEEENILIEPIINEIAEQQYRYWKIKNSEFSGVVFTITEIQFVPTKDLPNAPEDVGENEKTATGRVLFEETTKFTSKELLNNEVFGTIVRDVFDKIVSEFVPTQDGFDENSEASLSNENFEEEVFEGQIEITELPEDEEQNNG